MTTKAKQIWAVIGFVFVIAVIGWNVRVYQDLNETKSKLKLVNDRAINNSNAINADRGANSQIYLLRQDVEDVVKRVENTENWIWNFEDIMFGPADPPSTNNVGE